METSEKLKTESEKREAEKRLKEIEEKRFKAYHYMSDQLLYETVIVCFPHTIHPEYGLTIATDIEMLCRALSMYITHQVKFVITREIFDEVRSFNPEDYYKYINILIF